MGKHDSDAQYDRILMKALGEAVLTGPMVAVPIWQADLVAVSTVWTALTKEIAAKNGVPLDVKQTTRIILGILTGLGGYAVGVKAFLKIGSKIPGFGMVFGSSINAAINATLTLWFAFATIDLYDQDKGGLEGYTEYILNELKPTAGKAKIVRTAAFFSRCGKRLKNRFKKK